MSSIVITGSIPARRSTTGRAVRSAGVAPSARSAGTAGRAAVARQAAAPLRLTRRGRVVVRLALVVLVVVAVAVGVLATGGVAAAGREARQAPATVHVVLPGETLWQIAGTVAPDADPRDVVARIVRLNDLPGADVRAGQRLVLPVVR